MADNASKSISDYSSLQELVAPLLLDGVANHRTGQLKQARMFYDLVLRYDPQNLNGLQLSALVCLDQEEFDTALAFCEKALLIDRNNASVHLSMGNALAGLCRLREACLSYQLSYTIDPNQLEALKNRALTLQRLGFFEEAHQDFDQVIKNNPDDPELLNSHGVVLTELKEYELAILSFDRAIALRNDFVEAFHNRANTLSACERYDDALADFTKAHELDHAFTPSIMGLGDTLVNLSRQVEALPYYQRLMTLTPDDARAFNNMGAALHALEKLDCAILNYDKALSLKPNYPDANYNKSFLMLLFGDYLDGWKAHEWRLEMGDLKSKLSSISLPRWCGESNIDGKRILITAEQGLGDFIHFSRYIPMLFDKGAQVVLETPEALKSLASSLHPDLEIVESGCDYPDAEVFCPIMSLPHAFSTTVDTIPGAPYLFANTEKGEQWRTRLGRGAAKKIGLVWSGNKAHKNDHNRSTDLRTLEPLFSLPFEWHSLQKELRSGDAEFLEQYPSVQQHQDQLSSFDDTAALIDALDLVITVDTSVAHLAGALGKPVWIMLPKVPDYRWMLDRNDTPWYPSARLFRQTTSGDWSDVVWTIAKSLQLR